MFKKDGDFYAVLLKKESVLLTLKELRDIYESLIAHLLPFKETVFHNPYMTITVRGCNDVIFDGTHGTTIANIEDVISELDLFFINKIDKE